MRKRPAFRLTMLLVASAAIPAAFASGASDAHALIALEHQWLHAAMTQDRGTLARILAPDFVDVSWRGAVRTRGEILDQPAAPAASGQELKGLKARIYGDTAVVNGLNLGAAKGRGWEIRFTDVFVKRHGVWRAVSAQETLVQPAEKPK